MPHADPSACVERVSGGSPPRSPCWGSSRSPSPGAPTRWSVLPSVSEGVQLLGGASWVPFVSWPLRLGGGADLRGHPSTGLALPRRPERCVAACGALPWHHVWSLREAIILGEACALRVVPGRRATGAIAAARAQLWRCDAEAEPAQCGQQVGALHEITRRPGIKRHTPHQYPPQLGFLCILLMRSLLVATVSGGLSSDEPGSKG